MRYILYFFLALTATSIGALTGMGGGVIIKPAMDTLGHYDPLTSSALSSIAVLFMATVSVCRQIRYKRSIRFPVALSLSVGSLIGGTIGQLILSRLADHLPVPSKLVVIQNLLLTGLLVVVYIYTRSFYTRSLNRSDMGASVLAGALSGTLSSFLGIGGGPFNVVLFQFVFGCNIKEAAFLSILTILVSQGAKCITLVSTGAIASLDYGVLLSMVTGAMLGGWAGSKISSTVSDKKVEQSFRIVQILVFGICFYNVLVNIKLP